MSDHCFTYGSLMCEDIMTLVTGVAVRGVPAILRDHTRHPVRDEEYPGMVPRLGQQVGGVLYRDLPPDALRRLDDFEGEMYARQRVSVWLENGNLLLPAWAYVFRPAYAGLLQPGDWDFQRFLTEGKARFERHYLGFGLLEQRQTE